NRQHRKSDRPERLQERNSFERLRELRRRHRRQAERQLHANPRQGAALDCLPARSGARNPGIRSPENGVAANAAGGRMTTPSRRILTRTVIAIVALLFASAGFVSLWRLV